MTIQNSFVRKAIMTSLIALISFGSVLAQDPTSDTVSKRAEMPLRAVKENDLYCAGYIQAGTISTNNKIIGAYNEADQFAFAQNDFLYINSGRDQGVSIGDTFAVVRPRGEVKSKWSNRSNLGFYVQELGAVEVVSVKQDFSIARVATSCDTLLLGDLVQLTEKRSSPVISSLAPVDRFADPSGKSTGRILMARDGVEAMASNFIAYVDLGNEDNVKIGDKLTIFRPLAKGNLFSIPDRETAKSLDYGFESNVYRGGKFSNKSTRKKGEKADGPEVKTDSVRKERRADLRKVVGEAMILNVKERTATIVITKSTQEIHTGDWVEIQ